MEFPVLDMKAKQEDLRKSSELDFFDEMVVFFKLLYNQVRLSGRRVVLCSQRSKSIFLSVNQRFLRENSHLIKGLSFAFVSLSRRIFDC